MRGKLLLVGASVFAFASPAIGTLRAVPADVTDLPQLQERCGNDAATFFTRQQHLQAKENKAFEQKTGHPISYNYEKNYNELIKGCFICITITIAEPSSRDPYARIIVDELFNVTAQRMLGYGIFVHGQSKTMSQDCKLNGVECSSEEDWWTKVTPYVPAPSK